MDIRKTKLLFLTLFFLQFFSANASHIVGGVMNYKYLGNNNFEITLFVYRDDIRAIFHQIIMAIQFTISVVAETIAF